MGDELQAAVCLEVHRHGGAVFEYADVVYARPARHVVLVYDRDGSRVAEHTDVWTVVAKAPAAV